MTAPDANSGTSLITGRIGAFRFCRDVEATARLFRDLGFVERLRSDHGGFTVLRGAAGEVQLHSAATGVRPRKPGETELYLSVPDLDDLVASLPNPQLVVVSDEAWGRVALVQHPAAHGLWIDEVQRDLYGYHLLPPDQDPKARLTMVSVVPDPVGDAELLNALTVQVSSDSGDGHVRATWGEGSGVLELRPVSASEAGAGLCVCVETPEPLPELSLRLQGAGWQVGFPGDADGREKRAISVLDPDGALVTVRHGPVAGSPGSHE